MLRPLLLSCILPLLALGVPLHFAAAQDLPPEAQTLLDAANQEWIAIQKKAEADLAASQAKLAAQMKDLERQLRLKGMNDAAARVADAMRRLPNHFSQGSRVEVEWQGHWFPARILKSENGRYFIHYDNYGAEWDEWVGPQRIRKPAEPPTPKERDLRSEIQSGGAWYPGKVLKKDEKTGRYYVLYHNQGIDWEEWVTADRIRPTPKP